MGWNEYLRLFAEIRALDRPSIVAELDNWYHAGNWTTETFDMDVLNAIRTILRGRYRPPGYCRHKSYVYVGKRGRITACADCHYALTINGQKVYYTGEPQEVKAPKPAKAAVFGIQERVL